MIILTKNLIYLIMGLMSRFFKLFAEYFVFLIGFLFIFVVGLLYAYIRPEGLLFNVVFLVIAIGWIVFLSTPGLRSLLKRAREDGA